MLNEKIKQESAFVDLLLNEIGKVIVGQRVIVEKMVIGLISNGHILLEGVPGFSKNFGNQNSCRLNESKVSAYSVYTGSSSSRFGWNDDL